MLMKHRITSYSRYLGYLVVAGFLMATTCALADGGFLPYYGRVVWEPNQQAFIKYDEESNTEELILLPTFHSNSEDFGWVVPVPSLPNISVSEVRLFYECAWLTAPLVKNRGNSYGCSARTDKPVYPTSGGVDIHDEQIVGIYRTLTVSSTDSEALSDSLTAWGFLHEENSQTVQDAFEYYIERSWYFVAMKIDTTQLRAPTPDILRYGSLEPVQFNFTSEAIVYPLRISAISAPPQTELLIYTCANGRLTFPGAITEYANELTSGEMGAIQSKYPVLAPHLHEGWFLTKLRRQLTPDEMTEDLLLIPAASNDEYREVRYTSLPFTDGVMLALAGLLFIIPRIRKRRV